MGEESPPPSLPLSLSLCTSVTQRHACRKTSLAAYEVASHITFYLSSDSDTNKRQNSAVSVLCTTSLLQKKEEEEKPQQINFLQLADTTPFIRLVP